MQYATYGQMLQTIGTDQMIALTDREQADAPNENTANAALQMASRKIDGYLTHRYSLPLSTSPETLQPHTIDLAIYSLARDHSALTDDIIERHKSAIRFLELIASGKAGLGVDEPKTSNPGDAQGSDNVLFDMPTGLVMSRKNLDGM
ncbi:MAG: DUF1320 domain-containing protein [Cohaesibacteraceae bacterium]|nr:DUF1320 domain-containing protein [Cohaesibacteraceae bacterium]